jgi:hypothetical protein
MRNIFRKRPNDKDRYKMEFADYALAVFMALIIVGILYWLTEILF